VNTSDLSLLAAFLIGALGSFHCVGMCGGIAGVLSAALPSSTPEKRIYLPFYLVAYNAGRILSYTIAGAATGLIGGQILRLFSPERAHSLGQMIAGGFMIALGLYLAGWWHGLAILERQGQKLWRRIEPLGRQVIPVRSLTHALILGAVWGWLPCGLVYSTLAWSLAAGSAAQGASLMLAFGLGTLPMLLLLGGTAKRLVLTSTRTWFRRSAGTLITLCGIVYFTIPATFWHSHLFSAKTQDHTSSAIVAADSRLTPTSPADHHPLASPSGTE